MNTYSVTSETQVMTFPQAEFQLLEEFVAFIQLLVSFVSFREAVYL